MSRLKVAVSPYFNGEDFKDEKTGILFEKPVGSGFNIYSIPEDKDLSGIARAVQLNTLILLEGELPKVKNEEVKKEEKKEVKEEVKAEEKKPAPRKKAQPAKKTQPVKAEEKEEE